MPERVADLFTEYADAYVRGEEPRASEYLARAGAGADELAQLLNTFVASAPRPPATPDALAVVSAWAEGEPPLVRLRASHSVRVDDVVDAIVEEAGLAATGRAKVKRYYQRLEEGLLPPDGVSEQVWRVLRRLIGPVAEAAASWRAEAAAAEPAYFRATHGPLATSVVAREREAPRDEVDELFTSGR
jgi:hypothetical protein